MKKIIHKHKYIFAYICTILLLLLPPICLSDNFIYAITNTSDIKTVLQFIFANKTFKDLPELATFLKFLNCFFLSLFFFYNKIKKYFNIYVFTYMLFITFTQNVAYIKDYGFVISCGSFLLMFITCIIWLVKIKKEHYEITVNKHHLWLLIPMLLCIWYPLDKNAQFEFALNPIQHYFSSSMYCFNMPIFLSFLLIFYKNNKGVFYEAVALIGLLFGFVAFFVNLTYKSGIPNAIMHIPLIIVSATLFINSIIDRTKKQKS